MASRGLSEPAPTCAHERWVRGLWIRGAQAVPRRWSSERCSHPVASGRPRPAESPARRRELRPARAAQGPLPSANTPRAGTPRSGQRSCSSPSTRFVLATFSPERRLLDRVEHSSLLRRSGEHLPSCSASSSGEDFERLRGAQRRAKHCLARTCVLQSEPSTGSKSRARVAGICLRFRVGVERRASAASWC